MGRHISIRQFFKRGLRFFSGKARKIFPGTLKTPLSLGDKILADAIMLAEIPSPTLMEEMRAHFVLERLAALGAEGDTDEQGNIFVRLYSANQGDNGSLLFFTDLGTNRWHSLHSLSRLDASAAKGAGLADVLGTASLLSLIEGIIYGRIKNNMDLMFLFSAHSFDDPKIDVFEFIVNNPGARPAAALGVQGFSLGSIISSPEGNYRLEVKVVSQAPADDSEEPAKRKASPQNENSVIGVLTGIADSLLRLQWDDGSTHCFIRRMEGGTGFGTIPAEGIMDIEIDSHDAASLETALKTVESVITAAAEGPGCSIDTKMVSHIPAGDPEINEALSKQIIEIMKDLRIKVREKKGVDPASFLLNNGIPSLSLGIADGRIGLDSDTVIIASVEKGRQLLERVIEKGQIPKI